MQKRSVWALAALVLLAGCSRTRYRQKADVDTYALLHEKVAQSVWQLPSDFDVVPRPDSRLYDPSFIDDPVLPDPSPQLYAYRLPQLPERDPARFSPSGAFVPGATTPLPGAIASVARIPIRTSRAQESVVALVSYQERGHTPAQLLALSWPNQPPQPMANGLLPPSTQLPTGRDESNLQSYGATDPSVSETESLSRPIHTDFWNKVPVQCRARMLEFKSIRGEFQRSFMREPNQSERDQSPRFALEDIVATAQLNSRDYQSQKETLYSVAMRLSLERFDYDLKFSTGGNRTATNYTHARDAGVTVNSLAIPTIVQADKMLTTGADLLARFSNSVVMTFNGPSGFAADVGSDLLLDISQTIFQRDVRFETLTQSERDVIYAARNFRRFRKTLFTGLTSEYYTLLRSYRGIEIQSQNYFTLVRSFQRQSEEVKNDQRRRIELDQTEQQVLSSRRSLVNQCNSLERALDNLKIRMGLPTETPINLNLEELDGPKGLILRDELAVAVKLIDRARARIVVEQDRMSDWLERAEQDRDRAGFEAEPKKQKPPSPVQLFFWGSELIERILKYYSLQREMELPVPDSGPLEFQRLRMRIDVARLEVQEIRKGLQTVRDVDDPNGPKVLERSFDLIEEGLLKLQDLQLTYAKRKQLPWVAEAQIIGAQLKLDFASLDRAKSSLYENIELEQLRLLVDDVAILLNRFEEFSGNLDKLSKLDPPDVTSKKFLQHTVDESMTLVQLAKDILDEAGKGLIEIEMDWDDVDDAMITGLVKRLDLITERNRVADRWRQIKLAADELKSILNLSASQVVSTRSDVNRAFDFTFDESRTSLSATLDLPFNRRAQRNAFRQRLIDYQSALRSQTQLEDNIKLAIRNDLRALSLDKDTYTIGVAEAALSYERVVATELEFRKGEAQARDFLEAQQDYTESLFAVASDHIGYIVDRMQLFLDLELLEVDDSGFWTELYDEHYQPEGYYQLSPEAMPAYGTLPHGLMFSKKMRRMLSVPVGVATVHGLDEDLESIPAELPAPSEVE